MASIFELFRHKPKVEPEPDPVSDNITDRQQQFAEAMVTDLLYRFGFSLGEAIIITGRAHNLLVHANHLRKHTVEQATSTDDA
jgi:hypothetical protein